MRGLLRRPALSVLAIVLLAVTVTVDLIEAPAAAAPSIPPRQVEIAAAAGPGGLRAQPSARGADVVALNWAFKTPGKHYQVQWSLTAAFSSPANKMVTVASTAITGLRTNVAYYFRVRMVNAAKKPVTGWSRVVSATPVVPADPAARPLQVASYNVRNWKRTKGGTWKVRGPLVAATILSRKIDVVGVQELDFNTIGGVSQIDSLLRLLNAKGAHYRAVVSGSAQTAGTRIIYNADAVSVDHAGMRQLTTLPGDVKRYVVWAVLVQNSTGRKLFFATTHLVPNPSAVSTKKCSAKKTKQYKMRQTQANQVVAEIRASNPTGLPVILTGDMNSHKVQCPNNGPYRIYAAAGLVDPLGNPDFSKVPVKPTTEVRIHSEWDTSNHYARKPVRHNIINGHHVDYVWVGKSVKTLEYEVVVKIKDSTLKYVGRHASDHNMVRASVLIPAT